MGCWGNGIIIIITSDCGSFPHSLLSTSKQNPHQALRQMTFAVLGPSVHWQAHYLFSSQNRMEMEHHRLYMNIALSDYVGMV
jgi:hypothetical protein